MPAKQSVFRDRLTTRAADTRDRRLPRAPEDTITEALT